MPHDLHRLYELINSLGPSPTEWHVDDQRPHTPDLLEIVYASYTDETSTLPRRQNHAFVNPKVEFLEILTPAKGFGCRSAAAAFQTEHHRCDQIGPLGIKACEEAGTAGRLEEDEMRVGEEDLGGFGENGGIGAEQGQGFAFGIS